MNDLFLAFIIGTFVSFISMFYIFNADMGKNKIPMIHILPFLIALLYGIANMYNIFTKQKYTWIIGGVVGLIMSILGRFYLGNLPVKLFGFTEQNKHMVHPIAVAFYVIIFQYILKPINKQFI